MMEGHFRGAVISKINLSSLSFLTKEADAFVTDANGVIILAHDPPLVMMAVPGARVNRMSARDKMSLYHRSDFPELKIMPWKRLPDSSLNGSGTRITRMCRPQPNWRNTDSRSILK